MEPKFQTSFIPKNPVISKKEEISGPSSVSIFSVLGIIVFVAMVASSAFVFIYKGMVSKSVEEAKVALKLEKDNLDKKGIDELLLASDQIKAVKLLLDKHVAVSNLFVLLESLTIPDAKFSSFSFESKGKGLISVSINLSTLSYPHLARQSDIFKTGEFIKKVVVSGMDKTQDNFIEANIDLDIDSKSVSYKEALQKLSIVN